MDSNDNDYDDEPPLAMLNEHGLSQFSEVNGGQGETDTGFLEEEDDLPVSGVPGVDRIQATTEPSSTSSVVNKSPSSSVRRYEQSPDHEYLDYLRDCMVEDDTDLKPFFEHFYPFKETILFTSKDYLTIGYLDESGTAKPLFLKVETFYAGLNPEELIEVLTGWESDLPIAENERLVKSFITGIAKSLDHIKQQQGMLAASPPVPASKPSAPAKNTPAAPSTAPNAVNNPSKKVGQSSLITQINRSGSKKPEEPTFKIPVDEPAPKQPQSSQEIIRPEPAIQQPPAPNYDEQFTDLTKLLVDSFRTLNQTIREVKAQPQKSGNEQQLDALARQLQEIKNGIDGQSQTPTHPVVPPESLKAIQLGLNQIQGLVNTHTDLITKQTQEYANLPAYISRKTWFISVGMALFFFLLMVTFGYLYIGKLDQNKRYSTNFLKYEFLRNKATVRGGDQVFKPAYDEVEKKFNSPEFEIEFENAKDARETENAAKPAEEGNDNAGKKDK